MNIHMNRADANGEVVGEIDIDKMKQYIAFCKAYVRRLRRVHSIILTPSSGDVHLACLTRQLKC